MTRTTISRTSLAALKAHRTRNVQSLKRTRNSQRRRELKRLVVQYNKRIRASANHQAA